jgi:DNA repair protein RadD
MTLRPYQARAVDASINWMRQSVDPFIIEAATGAGKSHIIAEVAARIHAKTGKRVLCLAPSAELVTQNRAKFLASGNPCSMFSASAGAKELRHPVVFGSPLTVKNRISRFCQAGDRGYSLVVIDEAHGITPTVRGIVDAMRGANPNLRVMGLTATPYRLGSGYIFRQWPDGRVNPDATSRDPYFTACVDVVGARELIDQGYLAPPVIGEINAESYDTSALVANARGQFDADAVDRAYHGHGRKTASIVSDVVAQSRDRKGVIFFAATVQHAQEVMASLPPHMSALVTGETPKAERASILRRFVARQIKYLVNVSVLTTGFDAPHVDVIAILRKTESVGLLQQIIGRGLRLDDGKRDCLVLDYTTNLDDHCPDGDLFAPVIRAGKNGGNEGGSVKACCEWCGFENEFALRPDTDPDQIDRHGYVIDLAGHRVQTQVAWDEANDRPVMKDLPAHFGRRCMGLIKAGPRGEHARCEYRWTSKECLACGAHNDIAARYCCECKAEIVDPNEKLRGDFKDLKRDPIRRQTDRVVSMECKPGVSAKGNKTLRVDFVTEWRSFSIWLLPEGTHSKAMRDWGLFCAATATARIRPDGDAGPSPILTPTTVTYQKDAESGFYRVHAYNAPADELPERAQEAKHAAE